MSAETNNRMQAGASTTGTPTAPFSVQAGSSPSTAEVEKLVRERDEAIRIAREMDERRRMAESTAEQYAVQARQAQAAIAECAALRSVAERRAAEADRAATDSTFGFYLVLAILLALLVIAAFYIFYGARSESVAVVQPGMVPMLRILSNGIILPLDRNT